jgi:hypothetical protein
MTSSESAPFIGMNPALETPDLWTEVHHRLISAIAIHLGPSLRPKYRVAIEKQVYFSEGDQAIEVGIPDATVLTTRATATRPGRISAATGLAAEPTVSPIASASDGMPLSEGIPVIVPMRNEVKEGYLEIREVATGRVITTLEVLSPTNKRTGYGRNAYEAKRNRVLASQTHLVEIDLLRQGKPMDLISAPAATDYRVLVSRSETRPHAVLYGFNVSQPIPPIPIPLEANDHEPSLDLQAILYEIYEQASFDLTLGANDPEPR